MPPSPGAYLKCRRTASGLTVDDVVRAIETDPSMPLTERIEWVRMIEADLVAVRWSTIIALRQIFPFDLAVLERLSHIHDGADLPAPRLCRICRAGETGPAGAAIQPWAWDQTDLCIGCASAR